MLGILILQKNPERIKKTDKKAAEKLHYDEIKFPVQERF